MRATSRRLVTSAGPATRERRIALVVAIAERFMYDLGMMLSGRDDCFDEYVAPEALRTLRATVQPFLAGDASFRPDFGEDAQLIIDGSMADTASSVTAHVEFVNCSSAERGDGSIVATRRRALRLTLVTDPAVMWVIAHRLDPG